jgi:hypothetical protein
LTLVVEEFKQAKKEFTMEQELKQRLDKIEAKLDQILELAGGEKGSTILSEVMECRRAEERERQHDWHP